MYKAGQRWKYENTACSHHIRKTEIQEIITVHQPAHNGYCRVKILKSDYRHTPVSGVFDYYFEFVGAYGKKCEHYQLLPNQDLPEGDE